jgi:hypothetical protein
MPHPSLRRTVDTPIVHTGNDFSRFVPPRHSRCSVIPTSFNPVEVYAMTRTFGAAIGVVIVLLFFASLTFEQNRALTLARATVSSHR